MFQFDAKSGIVENIKTDKGSSEDAKVIETLRIKVVDVRPEPCGYVLGADDTASFLRAKFRTPDIDPDESPILSKEGPVPADFMVENGHRLRISSMKWINVTKLYAVKVESQSKGLSTVWFVATVQNPPDGFHDAVAALLKSPTKISLEQDPKATASSDVDERQTSFDVTNDGDSESANVNRAKAIAKSIRDSKPTPRKKPKAKRAA